MAIQKASFIIVYISIQNSGSHSGFYTNLEIGRRHFATKLQISNELG